MPQTKVCSRCKKDLDLSKFVKSKSNKFGVSSFCKDCTLEYNNQRAKDNAGIDPYKIKKECSYCKKELPGTEFFKSKLGKYGLGSKCKSCTSKINSIKSKINRSIEYPKSTTKKCTHCGGTFKLTKFKKSGSGKYGRESKCYTCRNVIYKKDRTSEMYIGAKKVCCDCKKELTLGYFHKNKKEKYGRHYRCKKCESIYRFNIVNERNKKHPSRDTIVKECSSCGRVLPGYKFNKDKRGTLGIHSKCKECVSFEGQTPIIDYEYRIKEKECSTCLRMLPIEDFWKDNKGLYGRRSICITCCLTADMFEYAQDKNYQPQPNKNRSQAVKYLLELGELIEGSDGFIQGFCKYCNELFTPTKLQIYSRYSALLSIGGDSNLYCSNECKQECPTFGRISYQKDHPINIVTTTKNLRRELLSDVVRDLAIERDSSTCQICGITTDRVECHHIEPLAVNPIIGSDLDNIITLCTECHKKVHTLPGCGYNELKKSVIC